MRHAETCECGSGCASLGQNLCDRLLGVLCEVLIQQGVLLEEALQATLNNLVQNLLGLALSDCGLASNALLGLDLVCGDGLGIQVLGAHCSNVNCNVVCDLVGVLTGDSQQNANLCRQVLGGLVQVNCNVLALNACNAADNDLLAEQCTSVGGQLLNGLAS